MRVCSYMHTSKYCKSANATQNVAQWCVRVKFFFFNFHIYSYRRDVYISFLKFNLIKLKEAKMATK
jgi:hypothetical protein